MISKKTILTYFFSAILLFIIISFFLNLGILITDFFAGKEVRPGYFFYSNLSNESWLSFWGSCSTGILAFILIFHYQEQLNLSKQQFKEQVSSTREELNLLKEQIASEKQHYNQQLFLEKINNDKNILKTVLKNWDNSIFDEFKSTYSCFFITKDKNKLLEDCSKIRDKIISIANINFLEIELLNLRINMNSENSLTFNVHQNNEIYTTSLSESKNKIYSDFEKLKNKISILNDLHFDESKKMQMNYSEEDYKNFCLLMEKHLDEYSDLYINTINSISIYLHLIEQTTLKSNFDFFYDSNLH